MSGPKRPPDDWDRWPFYVPESTLVVPEIESLPEPVDLEAERNALADAIADRLLRARAAGVEAAELVDGHPADAEAGPLRSRGGPPPGDGLDIATLRAALRDWEGPWPPTQAQITDWSARRVRQVLQDAGTDWRAELETAEPR